MNDSDCKDMLKENLYRMNGFEHKNIVLIHSLATEKLTLREWSGSCFTWVSAVFVFCVKSFENRPQTCEISNKAIKMF